jgi:hypothetical protein
MSKRDWKILLEDILEAVAKTEHYITLKSGRERSRGRVSILNIRVMNCSKRGHVATSISNLYY